MSVEAKQQKQAVIDEIKAKLATLTAACEAGDDNKAREALRSVVPTYHKPEDVNEQVGK